MPKPSEIRKVLVGAAGLLADLIASGVLHGDAEKWAHIALSIATLAGIYSVPNKTSYRPKHGAK